LISRRAVTGVDETAEFWIREYRIDGFRIDEFKGINNWDFVREFRQRAEAAASGRPFIVIAEDSARRPEITQDIAAGGRVVNAMWDFDTPDEVRRLLSDHIWTQYGKPSRSARVRAMIVVDGMIDGDDWRMMWNAQQQKKQRAKFTDMAQRIVYGTSHDTQQFCEQRLYPYFMEQAHSKVGNSWGDPAIADAHPIVMEQVFSVFAITLTLPGIPMFLAGEEFADLHDRPHEDWRQKMADPCNWARADIPTHKALVDRVRKLIQLRAWEQCLQRNEVVFFGLSGGPGGDGFHPTFDENSGARVFA